MKKQLKIIALCLPMLATPFSSYASTVPQGFTTYYHYCKRLSDHSRIMTEYADRYGVTKEESYKWAGAYGKTLIGVVLSYDLIIYSIDMVYSVESDWARDRGDVIADLVTKECIKYLRNN